jgi:outer membrane protein OmpA-like peptidoglycan-associated protein
LYFASNGLTGFGGYDIFYTEKNQENAWSKPVNVGRPINNHQDQFSLFITADGKKGYYSHEEYTSQGFSAGKIYEMDIPEQSQLKFRTNYIKGIVSDKGTALPLKAVIELIDIEQNRVVSKVSSDSITGEYLMTLTQGAEYALYVRKQGYLFRSLNFNYSKVKDFEPIILNIALERVVAGSVAVLNNIFFDFDSYQINSKSIPELQKVILFMRENSEVRIEISGHTDNVGAEAYNQNLSTQRALAVMNYLIEQGISAKRLLFKGYGSSKPISSNETEEGRQLNRRIEFTVL